MTHRTGGALQVAEAPRVPKTDRPRTMPKVIVQFQGQEYSVDLKEGSNVIGRSSKCTIPLRDTNTSREHCEIRLAAGVATVLDKGSMNGTLVNGKRVPEARLSPGDKIVIGQTSIFFEQKPAGTPAATPSVPPQPSADIPTQRGAAKSDSEIRKGLPKESKEPKPQTRRGVSVSALLKDYSIMGSDRGGLGGAVIAVVLGVVILVGLGWFLFGRGGAADGDLDPDNLARGYFSFETSGTSGAHGWMLSRPYKTTIRIDPAQAHHGSHSLMIEKKGDPSDRVVEVVTAEQFALKNAKRVEASAWVRSEGFSGWCAIKVNWFTAVNGPLLMEEFSPGVSKPADWAQIQRDFMPPPGAGAFSVALCAIGHSGSINFDEARIYARDSGGTAPKEAAFAPFNISFSPSGAFTVVTENKTVLANVQIALDSDQHGRTTQALAEGVTITPEEKAVRITGKLASPVDLKTVPFEVVILAGDGEVRIGVESSGEGMRQVERMLLLATTPRADVVSGLPSPNEPGTPRVTILSEGTDTVLEYVDLMKVSSESAGRGAKRLVHTVPTDPSAGKAAMGLTVRRGGGGGPKGDPLKDALRAERDRKSPGEALRILNDALKTVREPAVREQILAEIKRLDLREKSDWNDVESKYFLAWISRRSDLCNAALDEIAGYQRRWSGEAFGPKAQKLRTEIEDFVAKIQGANEEDRARRILDQAKAYREKGQRSMARTLCELIRDRFVATKAKDEALEMLKLLDQP